MSKISIEEYQELSKRTNAKLQSALLDNVHMILGMQTETAEISDVFKKSIAYGRDMDWVNVKEELGDLMFYVVNMCNINGWDLRDILETNIEKLKLRFPEKFEKDKALNRDLDKEREILER